MSNTERLLNAVGFRKTALTPEEMANENLVSFVTALDAYLDKFPDNDLPDTFEVSIAVNKAIDIACICLDVCFWADVRAARLQVGARPILLDRTLDKRSGDA